MKGIIEFDLDDLDDIIKFKRYNKSDNMAFMLHELLYNSKKSLIYSLENKEIDKYEVVEMVFERIFELVEQHKINLDEIII